ncbi:MAG: acetate kinase [Acetobacteraceae bacterium]
MAGNAILVLNAGSSSVKFSLFRAEAEGVRLAREGQVSGIGAGEARLKVKAAEGEAAVDQPAGGDHHGALAAIERWMGEHRGGLQAVGHRVVHGGAEFAGPVLIEGPVLERIEALVPLAPLHQPHAIEAIRAAQALFPGLQQVACFDTAFHQGVPALARLYGLPRRLTEAGIRGYGFHGLSYEFIASRLPEELRAGRVVVAHLGNGASLCAMRAGRSVATTMGFTALDGLVMGTRCGALDPGVVPYLMRQQGLSAAAVEHMLYEESGLLGVSGVSADMRELAASRDTHAKEAIDLFVYRLGRELGSMAAALGGVDGVVFTGGIGENDAAVRGRVCRDAAWLGIALDPAANAAGGPRISGAGAASAWVIPTDENLKIAEHTRDCLGR